MTGVIDPEQDIESSRAVGGTKMLWATCVTTKYPKLKAQNRQAKQHVLSLSYANDADLK